MEQDECNHTQLSCTVRDPN